MEAVYGPFIHFRQCAVCLPLASSNSGSPQVRQQTSMRARLVMAYCTVMVIVPVAVVAPELPEMTTV